MQKSCGILLKRGDLYLIGHTTQPIPGREIGMMDGNWTIFKGLQNEGEDYKTTAYREFKEETGIDLQSLGLEIEPYKTYPSKNKEVIVFLCDDKNGITTNLRPVCNSFVTDNYPEIDDFLWVSASQARSMVYPSHRILFSTYIEK
jgi:predicted NUDIX family NTP pyrophosphohydrolase